jgi:hypothetical protein
MDKPPVRLDQIDYTFYASYACFVLAAILFLLAICLRSAIQTAITCVQHAGAALNSMVLVLLVPMLQCAGFLCFWVVWMTYAINLASMGSIETATYPIPGSDGIEVTIREYEYDDFTTYCKLYFAPTSVCVY